MCLFTCTTVRAVHLELAEDMSADEFLLGLRRFISRQGTPQLIVSDNAQQFKCASTTLHKAWRDVVTDEKVCDFSTKCYIKWRFIVELAGGFYKRLVRLTKRTLRKTIGTRSLTQRKLSTVLTEVEAVINSCPLVYVDADINSSMVLTPSHFLSLHSNHVIPDLTEEIDPEFNVSGIISSSQQLLEIWKHGQKLLNQFWIIWQQEYLSNLRERPRTLLKGPHSSTDFISKVGDVVLVKENFPRGSWKVGRICELFQSRDKRIRSARIAFGPIKFINRALSFLYPIECPSNNVTDTNVNKNKSPLAPTEDDNDHLSDCNMEADVNDLTPTICPARKASIETRQRLRRWLNSSNFDDSQRKDEEMDQLSLQSHLCGECRNLYCE